MQLRKLPVDPGHPAVEHWNARTALAGGLRLPDVQPGNKRQHRRHALLGPIGQIECEAQQQDPLHAPSLHALLLRWPRWVGPTQSEDLCLRGRGLKNRAYLPFSLLLSPPLAGNHVNI